ncbi:MAG TPA: arginine deiminase family protein [Pyrinomonadaceae bacterium]|nr:arginine deiminase family protein [Pyrinomonadaceae bacterium]
MQVASEKKLSRAIVRPPGACFVAGLTRATLGLPDYQRALRQHAAYCEALETSGLTLTRLEADERFPDSTFVEDTAVMIITYDGGSDSRSEKNIWRSILTRPGAPSRRGEEQSIEEILTQLGLETCAISRPGTVDGGDICETEDHFFIGISERTNEAGASQLADLLKAFGYTSSIVDIRDLKTILHLKSGLAYLGDNRLVVIETLWAQAVLEDYDRVLLKNDEAYAANCVRVNDFVLVAAGFPRFDRKLQDLGYKTLALEMSEFQKMDGGLSCLSLRF